MDHQLTGKNKLMAAGLIVYKGESISSSRFDKLPGRQQAFFTRVQSAPEGETDLKKLNKGALINVAKAKGITPDENDTKAVIIQKILDAEVPDEEPKTDEE